MKDIGVFWPDNGWMNTSLAEKWIFRAFPTEDNGKKLLIWDSFKCHVAEEVKSFSMTRMSCQQLSQVDVQDRFKPWMCA